MAQTERILEIIEDVRALRFRGSIDDLDAHTSFCLQCRHLLIQMQRFTSRLLPDPEKERLIKLEVDIHDLFSAFEVQSELEALLPDIETWLSQPDSNTLTDTTIHQMIQTSVINQIKERSSSEFDTTVLVRLCEETNSCFSHGNIVATVLTMRSVLNYVPPVFGQKTFDQVVAQSGSSHKDIFTHLQNGLRKIADLHAHRTIAKLDIYPTASQVEPFKPQFECLLHEVISKLN